MVSQIFIKCWLYLVAISFIGLIYMLIKGDKCRKSIRAIVGVSAIIVLFCYGYFVVQALHQQWIDEQSPSVIHTYGSYRINGENDIRME
ncbi:MAG TPA: hypothetical protein DDZ91_09915 [Firmicutes bacterium]|nr:hypothetical protein [Bacillota bacterium]